MLWTAPQARNGGSPQGTPLHNDSAERRTRYWQVAFWSMQVWVAAQYLVVAGHWQVPAMQGMPGGQLLPHVPQLPSSLTTSMQTWLQSA